MIYGMLAPIYDRFNGDIDYVRWADFIEKIFALHYKNGSPDLVLDLGCGTGSMTIELASRGYDMTGVDISVDMLDVARERAAEKGFDGKILWLCQDMREFELYGTVDSAVCCLDGMNHLITPKDFSACLSLVHNYLIPDGLFIFDINGKYKFENIYGSSSYVFEEEGSFCVWQNYYNEKTKLCDFYITLFSEDAEGRYSREDEVETERMYTLRSVKTMLKQSGFEFIGAYSDYDMKEGNDQSERIYVVARCIKEEI